CCEANQCLRCACWLVDGEWKGDRIWSGERRLLACRGRQLAGRTSFVLPRVACLLLTTPVNSAYGRTGNAAEAKPRLAACSVAAAATESAHSPDATARAAQPGSTGDGNKSRAGRITGGFRRQRAQRG